MDVMEKRRKPIKVQLIAPLSRGYFKSKTNTCIPPLGLLSIASYIKKKDNNIDVEILDGEVLGEKKIKAKINADFVGISANMFTYKSALTLAKLAKKRGAKVLLGGVYANANPDLILKNRKYIDGIILKDGEIPFYEYITKKKLVHNLVFRKGKRIIHNPIIWPNLNELFPIDYSFLNIEGYITRYTKRIYNKRVLNIYSRKGCYWRNLSEGCTFCSIPKQKIRAINPRVLWKNIMRITNEYELDRVIDYSDQFLDDEDWIKRFIKFKPKNTPGLEVYSRVNDITEKNVKYLHKLGVKVVLLGIESGSQKCLNAMKKGTTVEQNEKAVKLLSKYNIRAMLFLIVGTKGESKSTLNESFKHIKKLIRYGNVDLVELGIFGPNPGSQSFNDLIKITKLRNKYLNKDIYDKNDIWHLSVDWINNFCKVNEKDLNLFIKKVENYVPNSATKKDLDTPLIYE